MNWTTGTWSRAAGTDGRITIASDWMPLRAFERMVLEEPLAVYGDLLPVLRSSDLNVVNVESVLGDAGQPILKNGPCLRARPEAVRSLAAAPFHVGCLANNHTLDAGPEGLAQTIRTLRGAGITPIGAGMTGEQAAVPLIVEVRGTTVGILNCAEGEACASIDHGPGAHPFELAALMKQIRELKSQADLVVAVFHGGREYSPLPPVYVVEGLRLLADAGASAIVAHHPHVPQGIEIYNDVPIVYSQGNFVFWEESDLYFRHTGYLVHLDLAGRQLAGLSLTPYRITREGLRLMNADQRAQLFGMLDEVSQLLADARAVRQAWDAWVDQEGAEGMFGLVRKMMQVYEKNPAMAAARMHNLFFCPAHREWYLNGLKRLSQGRLGDSPAWAKELVRNWTTLRVTEPEATPRLAVGAK